MITRSGFIIDLYWNDQESYVGLYVRTSEGIFHLKQFGERPLFFVPSSAELPRSLQCDEIKNLPLKSFDKNPVSCLYFKSTKQLLDAKKVLEEKGIRTFENDIRVESRYLMERFIKGTLEFSGTVTNGNEIINAKVKPIEKLVPLTSLSLDIETSRQNQLLSIGLAYYEGDQLIHEHCYMLADSDSEKDKLTLLDSEKKLLQALNKFMQTYDPDLILGWHIVGFDLKFLYEKSLEFNCPLYLSRDQKPLVIQENNNKVFCELRGRQIIDGPPVLRQNFFSFKNYKLDTVAGEVLNIGKDISATGLDKVEEIERRFREDKESLAHYNILDCKLVFDVYKKLNLFQLLYFRSLYSGQTIERVGFSTISFDHYMLPLIHRKGFVAPNVFDINREEQSSGGMVIEPKVGLFEHVAVFDFKSLYPSIINTFKIDPYSRLMADVDTIKTPSGHEYSKTENILPQIINHLLEQRQLAKDKGFQALSQAIKILMNSFYGVMGSSKSRFYHSDLPSSITQTGHWILLKSKDFFENKGLSVLYGDTDSLFVQFENKPSEDELNSLVVDLNHYLTVLLRDEYKVESKLDLEFEKIFDKIFFSSARNSELGAKKRYAGFSNYELSFVGMEYVRSDWTELAKEFQYKLFEALFNNQDLEQVVKETIKNLESGFFDEQLVLKKRLSKRPWEYTKSIPPHIKAALELPYEEQKKIREIEYVQTNSGPRPIQFGLQNLDYKYYIEKQIRPIAQTVLGAQNLSFDALIEGDQLSLF